MARINKQKVAVVSSSAPPYSSGGVASAHYNLFLELQRSGFEARMFTFGDYGRPNMRAIVRNGTPRWVAEMVFTASKIIFGAIDCGKKAYQTRDIISSLWGSRKMGKAILAYKPDVIILSDHGAPGLLLQKAEAKIILVSHHNPARFVGSKFPEFSRLDARWAIKFEQKILKKVDVIVCPSTYMKKKFAQTYKFNGPVLVIHNILDHRLLSSIKPSRIRHRMGLRKNDALVYMPSAGDRLKGSAQVLRIIVDLSNRFSHSAFYIPGNLLAGLSEQFRLLHPRPRVFWGGQLPYRQNLANVKACSFGISPSLLENYSMALLEAVQSGVPMIAFDTGGNSEIIRGDQNGYLVKGGDYEALITVAARLLRTNKLASLRRRTRALAGRQSIQKSIRAYIDLIQAI